MAKIKEEVDLNDAEDFKISEVTTVSKEEIKKPKAYNALEATAKVSCLVKKRIIVRHIPKTNGMVNNPKHILYGGMAENAVRYFTIPRLTSGMYVNVLTNTEKEFFYLVMGLEYNALSIYKKENNYWDNFTVRLTKQDNYLDLSNPDDYIKYKVLLVNTDYIAKSLKEYEDRPKVTHQFVLIEEGEETQIAKNSMTSTMECYKVFGAIEKESLKLRVILAAALAKPISANTKIEFLQTQINDVIQTNPKTFLAIAKDPLLDSKCLLKQGIEAGLIANRSGLLFLKEDNSPLCAAGEESTLNVAAKYINLPTNQNLKFGLEAKLKG